MSGVNFRAVSTTLTVLTVVVVVAISGAGAYFVLQGQSTSNSASLTITTQNYTAFSTSTSPVLNTSTLYEPANKSLIVLDSTNGSAACQNIAAGQNYSAKWSGNSCVLTASAFISSFALESYVTLEIFPGVTLVLVGAGGFGNYGTIINNGTIKVRTSLVSYGVIDNFGMISTNTSIATEFDTYFMSNGGTFENYGTFLINGDFNGYYQRNVTYLNGTETMTSFTEGDENLSGGQFSNGGVFDNYGTVNNTGVVWNGESGFNFNSTINNFGTFRNLEYAKFVNDYTINNNGRIINSGIFVNNRQSANYCGGNFMEDGTGAYSGRAFSEVCDTTSFQTSSLETGTDSTR